MAYVLFKDIKSIERLKALHYSAGIYFPDDLAGLTDNSKIFDDILCIAAYINESPIGFCFGDYVKRDDIFAIHFLYIDKACRTESLAVEILRSVYRAVYEKWKCEKFAWMYEINDPDKNPYRKLMSRSGVDITGETIISRRVFMPVELLLNSRIRVKDADERYIEKRGFTVTPFSELDESYKSNFVQKLKAPDDECMSLLPFTDDKYLDKYSYIITDSDGSIAGWAVLKDKGNRTVEIRRQYIVPEMRNGMLGFVFFKHCILNISGMFDTVTWQMLETNGKLYKLVPFYFKDCGITWTYLRMTAFTCKI